MLLIPRIENFIQLQIIGNRRKVFILFTASSFSRVHIVVKNNTAHIILYSVAKTIVLTLCQVIFSLPNNNSCFCVGKQLQWRVSISGYICTRWFLSICTCIVCTEMVYHFEKLQFVGKKLDLQTISSSRDELEGQNLLSETKKSRSVVLCNLYIIY